MKIVELLNNNHDDFLISRPRSLTVGVPVLGRSHSYNSGEEFDDSDLSVSSIKSPTSVKDDIMQASADDISSDYGYLSKQFDDKMYLRRSRSASTNDTVYFPRSSRSRYMSIHNITNPTFNPMMDNMTGISERTDQPRASQPNSDLPPLPAFSPGRRRAQSNAERRAKQRMIVKRCYYKKINTIKNLRVEVAELENQFKSILKKQEEQKRDSNTEYDDLEVRSKYLEVLEVKETLRGEHQRLRQLADEMYMKNQSRLRLLLDSKNRVQIFSPAIQN